MVLARISLIVVAFAIVVALARVSLIVVAFAIVFTPTVIAIGVAQAFSGDIRRSSMSAYRTSMSAMRTLRNIVAHRHGTDGARSGRAGLRPARQVLLMRPTVASHACTKSILIAEQPPSPAPDHLAAPGRLPGPSPPRADHTRCSRTKGQLLIIRTATKIQQRTGHRRVATVRLTATWQFAILPAEPLYCRCTPTEWVPCLRKPVSSMIHDSTGSLAVIASSA